MSGCQQPEQVPVSLPVTLRLSCHRPGPDAHLALRTAAYKQPHAVPSNCSGNSDDLATVIGGLVFVSFVIIC